MKTVPHALRVMIDFCPVGPMRVFSILAGKTSLLKTVLSALCAFFP